MVYSKIVYCQKDALVHTQVHDAANPNIAKKHGKTWFTVNIFYCKKAKLVHTQVPDSASNERHDQCTHHNTNITQNIVKHGIIM